MREWATPGCVFGGPVMTGMRIRIRATTTATNEKALITKHHAAPSATNRPAAMGGPIERERLNCREFMATARGITSLGTMLVRKAW